MHIGGVEVMSIAPAFPTAGIASPLCGMGNEQYGEMELDLLIDIENGPAYYRNRTPYNFEEISLVHGNSLPFLRFTDRPFQLLSFDPPSLDHGWRCSFSSIVSLSQA